MKRTREKQKLHWRDAPATILIIAINIAAYIALNTIPNVADKLLLSPHLPEITQRPWTLLTAFFSHELHFHLVVNMGLVFFFGKELEKITTAKTVMLTYMLTGGAGSLAVPPFALAIGFSGKEPIAGASAAAFGLVAAYAAMQPNKRLLGSKVYHWVVALFVYNVVWFVINPRMSVGAAAHGAGILVGLVCGYLFKKKQA